MKRKILLRNKKKHKRGQRALKKIKRYIENRMKFATYKFHPMVSIDGPTNNFEKLRFIRDNNSNNVYLIPVDDGYKPIEFKFEPENNVKRRCPNEREIIRKRIDILRGLYKSGKMCRNAYYTLKGLSRKDPINAEKFIKKHSIHEYEHLQSFKTTESILDVSISFSSVRPVTSTLFQVNLKEEN